MGNIKLSAPDWCFFRGDQEAIDYYRRLKTMGFQGVEMVDAARWDTARAAGLQVLNLIGPGMADGLNFVENHASLLPQLEESIRTAGANKIPHVIIFSGVRKGQADAEGIENLVAAVRSVLPAAERAGVTLVLEMLNSYDHVDYQAASSSYGFAVARALDSPHVKVIYDIYHMTRMGENPLPDILDNLAHIGHLHVAEAPTRTKPVARGTIDYGPLVKQVQTAGYNGYWGFEFLCKGAVLEELEESVALFKSYVA